MTSFDVRELHEQLRKFHKQLKEIAQYGELEPYVEQSIQTTLSVIETHAEVPEIWDDWYPE